MQFSVPLLIYEMPALEDYKALYPKHFYAKLVHKIATKVHWRTMLSEAQNHRCCWCGIKVTELRNRSDSATIEHVVPKSHGGADHTDNFAIACHSCNGNRGVRSVEDFMLQKQSAKDKASLRRELMNKFGAKSGNKTGCARLNRRLDLNQARNAVLTGLPNTFEPGSRAYNAYLRYSALSKESLCHGDPRTVTAGSIGEDSQIAA